MVNSPERKKTFTMMNSVSYVSINSFLQFKSSLKDIDLPVEVDILQTNDISDDLIERMIRNAEMKNLLVKGVQPKTDSGQSLQELCDQF